uniref:Uncharacterized protein n=1 Tax=Picea glauca TaxID=3330 RepID=A0A101LYH5_PICGL|nr:hypothetical protein ABT39_MTgene5866 [Picea glauca]QHR92109.1 hypothetical protein Q903MT_gene6145 [Picea sitchensis]
MNSHPLSFLQHHLSPLSVYHIPLKNLQPKQNFHLQLENQIWPFFIPLHWKLDHLGWRQLLISSFALLFNTIILLLFSLEKFVVLTGDVGLCPRYCPKYIYPFSGLWGQLDGMIIGLT